MADHSLEDEITITLDGVLRALANPVRRQVVTTLLNNPGGRVSSCAAFNVSVSRPPPSRTSWGCSTPASMRLVRRQRARWPAACHASCCPVGFELIQ